MAEDMHQWLSCVRRIFAVEFEFDLSEGLEQVDRSVYQALINLRSGQNAWRRVLSNV